MRFFSRAPRRHGSGRGRGQENRRVRFSIHFDSDSFDFRNFLATGNLALGDVVNTSRLPCLNSSNHNYVSCPRFDSQLAPLNPTRGDGWDVPEASLNNVNNWENLWPNHF